MKNNRLLLKLFALSCILFLLICAYVGSQIFSRDYKPSPYQPGKDVVWLPTEIKLTEKMLDLAMVTPRDYVIDLGSGDGRIVIAAARRGAKALGIEYNPDLVALSRRNALKAEVADRAEFVQADIFESDFSKATVITMFLTPELNLKLRPIILNMKPGVRVVSNSFDMFEWAADKTISIPGKEDCDVYFCKVFFWVVPARVEGLWQMGGGELILKQKYQVLTGEVKRGSTRISLSDGLLNGDKINFKCGQEHYSGAVKGDIMEGTLKTGDKTMPWRAKRIGDLPKKLRME